MGGCGQTSAVNCAQLHRDEWMHSCIISTKTEKHWVHIYPPVMLITHRSSLLRPLLNALAHLHPCATTSISHFGSFLRTSTYILTSSSPGMKTLLCWQHPPPSVSSSLSSFASFFVRGELLPLQSVVVPYLVGFPPCRSLTPPKVGFPLVGPSLPPMGIDIKARVPRLR